MKIYEIRLGDIGLACDTWHIEADCLLAAVTKAEQERSKNKKLWNDWSIISVREIGRLTK